jgi:hypothetical protein
MTGAVLVRRLLPLLSLAVLGVLVYDGWVFYSRWERNREVTRQKDEKEQADAHHTLQLIGNLKIAGFYADPTAINPGRKSRLCYSVIDAKSVRIEPPVQDLYPALSFCFDVAPRKTTEYRLIAQDAGGHTVTAETAIQVRP